jgi:hypothetical protein
LRRWRAFVLRSRARWDHCGIPTSHWFPHYYPYCGLLRTRRYVPSGLLSMTDFRREHPEVLTCTIVVGTRTATTTTCPNLPRNNIA